MSALPQALNSAGSHQLLASVWQRNLPLLRTRFALLRAAAQQAEAGLLTPSARKEAAETAHKLAGSLGMFGYGRGTEISRQLEQLLDGEDPVSIQAVRALTMQLGESVPIYGDCLGRFAVRLCIASRSSRALYWARSHSTAVQTPTAVPDAPEICRSRNSPAATESAPVDEQLLPEDAEQLSVVPVILLGVPARSVTVIMADC